MSTTTLATGSSGWLGSGTPDDRQSSPTLIGSKLVRSRSPGVSRPRQTRLGRGSASDGRGQRSGPIDAFPAHPRQLAAKVSVRRHLGIHRALQIEVADDRRRA